jgi:hypothetical protein
LGQFSIAFSTDAQFMSFLSDGEIGGASAEDDVEDDVEDAAEDAVVESEAVWVLESDSILLDEILDEEATVCDACTADAIDTPPRTVAPAASNPRDARNWIDILSVCCREELGWSWGREVTRGGEAFLFLRRVAVMPLAIVR